MRCRSTLFLMLLLAGFAPLISSGCGGKTLNPVTGKVVAKGTPAVGALVIFHPVGDTSPTAIRPSAITGEDGSYRLTTTNPGDGAPPGEYIVTVLWEKKPAGPITGMGGSGGESKSDVDALGGRYASPGRSSLRASVKSGPNTLDPFHLE